MEVSDYLRGKPPGAVKLFRRFREIVLACGPSEETPRKTIVFWKRKRVFAGAFIAAQRLELNVDLFRRATHPTLLTVFPTTKRVFTHRLRVSHEAELDEALISLVREAYDQVGPGTASQSGSFVGLKS